ncbi:M48 family metalloprotease [Proteiniborus sp.]|uniref:M48 family metalloprotease n=1 Tax=Proteiniborus sp. TaxID=2079015 RepID=UPI003331257D
MYLIAFLKNLIKKNNITASIYFLFNMFLVFLIFGGILLFTEDGAKGWQMGFIGIDKSAYTSKLLPLFYDVYNRARQISPSISNNISLFYSLDESANAFAIGRKTIVVTRGLMQLPDENIKAILAHEFGHIAHNDTDIVLAITVGNFIITSVYMFFLVIINISILIAKLFSSNKIGCIIQAVFNALLGGVFWLWMKFGQIMVMNSSRANEFSADEFSAHPSTPIRIKRLIDLGATYYQY